MKKVVLIQLILIAIAFIQVKNPFARNNLPLPKSEIRKSEISQITGNYYLAIIHPEDLEKYSKNGFTKSGLFEFPSKKLIYDFPYPPKLNETVFNSLNDNYRNIYWMSFFVKTPEEIALRIYENGKEKFHYRANQFCRNYSKNAFFSDSKEFLWLDLSLNRPIPEIDPSSEFIISANCYKKFLINYKTGEFQELPNPQIKTFGESTDYVLQISLLLCFLILVSVFSLKLQTKFLTYFVILICCGIEFFIVKESGQEFYRSIDEVQAYFSN